MLNILLLVCGCFCFTHFFVKKNLFVTCCLCPQVHSPESLAAESGAAKLVAACHEARQFTDVANFTLRCGVCQIGLKGEKEAVMHAKETGHQNFSEY